ncbi:MAG: Lin0512 family protein [Chloroflexi bacterium]|nr:Lin0512 family protein [Chloroflexota bacterium]
MAVRRCLLEMGWGADLHGGDYTKAATRAVQNALQHVSLGFPGVIGKSGTDLILDVTIGVAEPGKVDKQAIANLFPYGRQKNITVVKGGLDIPGDRPTDFCAVANAAVILSLDV